MLASVISYFNIFCQPCSNPTGPAGDDCISATPICDPVLGIDEYCDILDPNITGPSAFPGCPNNVLNNDEWFTFVASGNILDITITPSNCGQGNPTDPGIQAALYEGSCSGDAIATQCGCTTAPFNLTAPTTPGLTYYIVIDGCAGDICDYEIQDNAGTSIPVPPPDVVPDGPIEVCPNITTSYTLIDLNTNAPIPNGDIYTWEISDPTVGTFQTFPPTGVEMDILWNTEGTVQLCATGTNSCNLSSTMPPPECLTIIVESPPPVMDATEGCMFELVECPAAPGSLYPITQVFETISISQIDPAGCTYEVICDISAIIIPPTDLGQIELCSPAEYEVCGQTYFETTIIYETCTNVDGCDSLVIVDLAIFEPQAVIANPPELPCSSTIMLDGSNSTLFSGAPGASVDLSWTGPGIVGITTGPIITVNEPGEYCLTVNMSRNGTECTDIKCVTVTENSNEPNGPTLIGEDEPCEGMAYQYDAAPVGSPAPTGYGWITPNGEPFTIIASNTIEIDWTGSLGGDLCVFGTSTCGNGDTTCIAIVVGEIPNVPMVTGPVDVCAINQADTFFVSNPQAGVTYTWTIPNGASFNGSGDTITVNFDGANLGTGQVCATAINACDTSNIGCFTVNIDSLPPSPALTGPISVCSNGIVYNYSVSNGQTGDTYNWTVPAGATIIGSGSTVGVDFNGSQSGQVCASITNECGTGSQSCENVAVQQVPIATIEGTGELCEGMPEDIDLTITVTGAPPWVAEYTRDGTDTTMVAIPNSPFTLTVNQGGVYELVSLSGNSGCDGSVSGQATIIENPLPTAVLSGTDDICEDSNDQGELTIELTGTAPWTVAWESNTVPQAPIVINASPYTLMITEAQAGDIILTSVTDDKDCVGTVSGSGTVSVIQAPIVNNVERVCDPTNTTYTVIITIEGGDPTSYSVTPANGMLLGNTFTSNSIFSSIGYSFIVSDANDCDPVLVEGSFLCNCETRVGNMDLMPIDICGDGPFSGVYDNTNEFLDGDDVLNFILHSGNGTSIINPVVGTYTSPIDISFDQNTMNYGETYYLSAVIGNDDGNGGVDLNDPCTSVSLGTPVTFFDIPTAILSGLDAVCEGEEATLGVSFIGEAPWNIGYDDGTGVQIVTGITTNPYNLIVSPPSTGLNIICLTEMNDNNCSGTAVGCGEVTVHTGIAVDGLNVICNSTADGFVFSFNISGGDPNSYAVTGAIGSIVNGVFSSDEIATGMGVGFSVVVDDINGCDSQTVSQTEVVCDCVSDAGQMDAAQVDICGNGPITVPNVNNENLDGDDILMYYLHTGTSNNLVGVIDNNTAPTFSFNPAVMSYGTTYYVSSVVGNIGIGAGIDLSDPCLGVAEGTPIVFFEVPTASISGGTEICPGDATDLLIGLMGDSPWSVTVDGQVYDNINGSPFILPVEPDVTTTYQLTAVADSHCDNIVTDEETVTVHDPPTVNLDSEDCNATGTAYTVCFTIFGGDASGYAVTPNTGILTGNQFCSDLIASGDGYAFSVTDGHGCPPAEISNPILNCDCLTVAGDLDSTALSVCRNEMTPSDIFYDNSNEALDPDDVLCYVLFNGAVVLNTNPDEPVFGFNQGNMVLGQPYNICPVAGNDDGNGCVDFSDPCINIGGCVEVIFNPLPSATLSGSVEICQGEIPNLTIDFTGNGPWEITYENATGTVFIETAASTPYTLEDIVANNSTEITLTTVTDENNCTSNISTNNTATVFVTLPPIVSNIVEDCNALETEFTVTFDISGGGPSADYTVDPSGALVGNTYTSNPYPTNSFYSFLVYVNGCGPTTISGDHACSCLSQAGEMVPASLSICGNDLTTGAVYDNTNEVLDPNDIRIFILQAVNSSVIDTQNIIEINPNEPVFGFDPTDMQYGVTYFITAAVGNSNGSGSIDFDEDLCDVASNSIPVVFYPLPTVSISGPNAICEGDYAELELIVSGTAPYTIDFLANGIPGQLTSVSPPVGSDTITNSIPLPVTTTFLLASIQDANGCINSSNQSITIEVNPMVEAGSSLLTLEFCENENETVSLFDQLTGADQGGTWTNQSGQTVPNLLSVGSLPVGLNTFTYTVTALSPCPDDMSEVSIDITGSPVADAGSDQFLDCNITSVTLGIGNTSAGATTAWFGPGISDPSNPNPVISNAGTYTLTATIGNCTDVDVVQVENNETVPHAIVNANRVSCFGETDGYVIVESVVGGKPPYLFSLNGGPFLAQQSFLNLAPGTYTLVVEDGAGCTSAIDFDIGEPIEVTVDIIPTPIDVIDDPVLQLGDSVRLTAKSTPGFSSLDTIIWSPQGIDSLCPGCQMITVWPTLQTAYSVFVDSAGCTDSDIFTLFVSKERPVFVPNAFSPNDDRVNDLLQIYGGTSVAEIKSFLIFSRWGEAVYELHDFQPVPRNESLGWDGKLRGEFLNPGVFVWFAEVEFIDGSTRIYKGEINLIRNQ